jgi:hypothetical protein
VETVVLIGVDGAGVGQRLVERPSQQQEPAVSGELEQLAGGVGHLALRFAKHAGARVIGTGSARNREFVLSLGAAEFIDYTHGEVADAVSGVDVALDTVGGATTASLLPALREGDPLVTIGYPPEAPPQEHRLWVKPLIMRPSAEQLARISELLASGAVRVEIARQFGRADVQRARRSERVWTRARKDRSHRPVVTSRRWCRVKCVSFVLINNTTQEGAQ